MGIDLSSGHNLYHDLIAHHGHELSVEAYGGSSVTITCLTCSTVLIDADHEDKPQERIGRFSYHSGGEGRMDEVTLDQLLDENDEHEEFAEAVWHAVFRQNYVYDDSDVSSGTYVFYFPLIDPPSVTAESIREDMRQQAEESAKAHAAMVRDTEQTIEEQKAR